MAQTNALSTLAAIKDTEGLGPVQRFKQVFSEANKHVLATLMDDLKQFKAAMDANDVKKAYNLKIDILALSRELYELLIQDNKALIETEETEKGNETMILHKIKNSVKTFEGYQEAGKLVSIFRMEKKEVSLIKKMLEYTRRMLDTLHRIMTIVSNTFPETWKDYQREVEEKHLAELEKFVREVDSFMQSEKQAFDRLIGLLETTHRGMQAL